MCAPDPIFPDPNCILCWCPPSNIAYKPPVNKGSRAWWGAAQPLPFWLTSPVLRGKIANSTVGVYRGGCGPAGGVGGGRERPSARW